MSKIVPVLVAPMFDPGAGRIELDLRHGHTIGEIVSLAMPTLPEAQLDRLRVVLVTEAGKPHVVERRHWHRVRPKPATSVVIRLVPAKEALKPILTVVVSIAAVALGQYWALGLGFQAGTVAFGVASGLISLGVTVLGNLLINALIPPARSSSNTDTTKADTYSITGWQNRIDPNGVLPDLMGKLRYAPPFAAAPYTEIVGDIVYQRAVFFCGYGGDYGISLSNFRIGDTPIEEFSELTVEVREGLVGDAPLTLVTSQVIEEKIGAELVRPYPRDDAGNMNTDAPTIETPMVRYFGRDATAGSIIICMQSGLGEVSDTGELQAMTCSFRVRMRPANGLVPWSDVVTLHITAAKLETFYRQYTWGFPYRGDWAVEITRLTDETVKAQQQSRSTWMVLQTIRPEYPLNFRKPAALIAVRVKSTYQLNGNLDNFNVLGSRRALDWDAGAQTWVPRETSNPASAFRIALQSIANPKRRSDAQLRLAQIQSWHEYCTAKGLKYDRLHTERRTLREVMAEIAVAGRATQRDDGVAWGVIIDRPQDLIVDEVNDRNSWGFTSERSYVRPPDGVWVSFLDASNDYKATKRFIPWPGHSGDINLTEAWDMPGKTDAAEIYREATRRMYEHIYRPDVYTVIQDGPVRVATRGDLVVASFPALDKGQQSATVKAVLGQTIVIDRLISMVSDRSYAVRFRVYDAEDTIGISYLRPVQTVAGETDRVMFVGDGMLPREGSFVHFGEALTESRPLVVTRVEQGSKMSSVYRFADAAPIIDELTDAVIPPAWNGRVGEELEPSTMLPPTPKITSIKSGRRGTGIAGALRVMVAPGNGAVVSSSYRLQHRLLSSSIWSETDFPASDGGVTVEGYNTGDPVQLRVAAISPTIYLGPYGTVVSTTIGADDAGLPIALNSGMISVAALLGGATIMFSSTDDAATTTVQLYRSTSSVLNRATDAVGAPISVMPSRSYSVPDGDVTRSTLVANGGFDSTGTWNLGDDWSISSGTASHVDGAASSVEQAIAFEAGATYRLAYTLSGVTAGSITPTLTGGTTAAGVTRSANGNFSDSIVAASGNNTIAFEASDDFEGSVDNVVVFRATASCLPAGTHNYWLEPINNDGVAGPASGPFAVTIR